MGFGPGGDFALIESFVPEGFLPRIQFEFSFTLFPVLSNCRLSYILQCKAVPSPFGRCKALCREVGAFLLQSGSV